MLQDWRTHTVLICSSRDIYSFVNWKPLCKEKKVPFLLPSQMQNYRSQRTFLDNDKKQRSFPQQMHNCLSNSQKMIIAKIFLTSPLRMSISKKLSQKRRIKCDIKLKIQVNNKHHEPLNIRSSFSSDRRKGILSWNFSKESILSLEFINLCQSFVMIIQNSQSI